MSQQLKNLIEIAGIVFIRFRPVPRVWAVWLVSVNVACLFFINRPEAQVLLGVTALALLIMAVNYGRIGYTRIMGMAHALWIPTFAWYATRIELIQQDPALATWMLVLLATNAVCFTIDLVDAARYLRGEKAPHYFWQKQPDSATVFRPAL